jgi:alkanesulfonate monooxygenase SsuD/methylene tetrahydromethanopterin reductase-like flavin-dependent oxidoreductase (luciferase family)
MLGWLQSDGVDSGVALAIDVQISPAVRSWPELRDLAQAAEVGGYGAFWAFDHLAGASLHGDRMLETFTLLGALAVSTTTLELGTLVANVNNRTPALLAVAAASVDAIAGRQVYLGLGAGAPPHSRWSGEMRAVGQPVGATAAERHAHLAATLDLLERVYDPGRPPELATFPLPARRPWVLVGVNSVALAEVAGRRTDGVNVGWDHPRRDELLAAAVGARGGRPGFLLTAWTFWSPELLDPASAPRRAMAERRLDRLILTVPAGIGERELAAPLVG